ncbi:MAG: PEGA domain-containing protein [Myxococcota bacterium]
MVLVLLAPVAVAVVLFIDARSDATVATPPTAPPATSAPSPSAEPTAATRVAAASEDVAEPIGIAADAGPSAIEPDVAADDDAAPQDANPSGDDADDDARPDDADDDGAGPVLDATAERPSDSPSKVVAVTTPVTPTEVRSGSGRGELQIHARPWALVEVDGTPMGNTPRTLQLAPGPHSVRLTRNGRTHTTRVVVTVGRAASVYHDFGD